MINAPPPPPRHLTLINSYFLSFFIIKKDRKNSFDELEIFLTVVNVYI